MSAAALTEAADLVRTAGGSTSSSSRPPLVCGCCLGQSSNDANEIVECDSCGISVHEGCYGVIEESTRYVEAVG